MDLHVIGPLASPAERAAVDAVLGPPESGWSGGTRDPALDGHAARGGHAARSRRSQLLPALHAVQSRIGWISQPALNYVCRRLAVAPAEAYGVATFYALFSTRPRPPVVAHVCDDIACRPMGAEATCADLERAIGPAGTPFRDGRATWLRSPCLGLCDRAPAALVTEAGEAPRAFAVAPIDGAGVLARLEGAAGVAPSSPASAAVGHRPWAIAVDTRDAADAADAPDGAEAAPREPAPPPVEKRPRAIGEEHVGGTPTLGPALRHALGPAAGPPRGPTLGHTRLLARVGIVDPGSLADYRAHGGYEALARAIQLGPDAVIGEVTASRLVGRGGAAFPTGRKWAAVAVQAQRPHYLVCNADESEPGTFKDRVLLEGDPFSVVEAMTIAAFATGCEIGYLYIRGEYPEAEARIGNALSAARDAGLLGPDVLGSGFAFDVELRRGAGAYICGEETALFESIEGKRGEPRNKPPFPVEVGLFGRPTVVNNVETLVNVPLIVLGGGAAYAAIGTEGSAGPKLFCLSGHVNRPGVYEVEFGATLGDLIELAGGVPGGRAIRTILLGGAAGVFVGPDALHTPLTFEATRAIAATLGSGVVMVFDETADLVGTLRRIAQFFRDESCGQCVPCRVGTVRQEELLARLAAGSSVRPAAEELALLAEIGQAMRDASICGLGQTASSAIESALRRPGLVAL